MAGDDARYEYKDVRAIRGTEARTIAKWEKVGWELDTQSPGSLLQTKLSFRRPKPKIPWRLVAALGGAVLILATVGIIVSVMQGGGDSSGAATPSSQVAVAPSEQSPEPPEEASPAEPVAEEVLTVGNNADLAALLAGPDSYDAAEAFAVKYQDMLIEFDGNIAAMNNHGDYDTRYDMLIVAGDFSETTSTGPSFQFRDVNFLDLHLTGQDIPDSVGLRDNLHIVARVGDFNPDTGLFLLEPVSTAVR